MLLALTAHQRAMYLSFEIFP